MNDKIFPSLLNAKRVTPFLPDLWSTPSLSTEDLRAYWRFRRLFMDLKPHIDPEEDWARFAKWMKGADFSLLKRTPSGQLVAVISYKIDYRTFEGRPVTLLWPEYVYVLPEAQKSVGLASSMLFAVGSCLLRHPLAPIYIVGTGYLSGFVALAQIMDTAWLRDEPSMSPWEQSLWRTLANVTPGFDPVHKVVNMGTIPRNPRTTPPKNPSALAAWRHYSAHNPQWTKGYTCLTMCPVQISFVTKALRWLGASIQRER